MAVETMLEAPALRVTFREMWRANSPYSVDQASEVLSLEDVRVLAQVHPSPATLGDIAVLLSAVDTLWEVAYDLAAYRNNVVQLMPDTGEWGRMAPAEIHISRQSPMWVELVGAVGAPGSIAAATYGILRLLVNKPEAVGSAIPRIVAGWHKGMTKAERAARRRVLDQMPKAPRRAQPPTGEVLAHDDEMPPELEYVRVKGIDAGGPLIQGVAAIETTGVFFDVENPD